MPSDPALCNGVWCHHQSERFRVSGLKIAYSPPSLSAFHMETGGVLVFYTNLEVGKTLELKIPYKPSSIVAGKIARVLKWGNFIVQINSAEVPAHGAEFVCRIVKSLDVFFSGFALQNGIPLEAPFDNQNDAELTSVPKELLQKIPLENPFEVDELLEAFYWWDFFLRPAKIVEVTGSLVKIRYLGFSPEMDQWMDVSSRGIYPIWVRVLCVKVQCRSL